MPLTTGTTISCATPTFGGGINVWAANVNDITSFTSGATGIYSAVTMVATKVFYKFQCEQDTVTFKTTASTSEKGITTLTPVIEFYKRGMSVVERNSFQEIIDTCAACGVVLIIEDANSQKWVFGYSDKYLKERPVKSVSGSEASIGSKISDDNGIKMVMTCTGIEMPKTFSGTVPV